MDPAAPKFQHLDLLNQFFTWFFGDVMFHGHSGMPEKRSPGVSTTAAKRCWLPLPLPATFIEPSIMFEIPR